MGAGSFSYGQRIKALRQEAGLTQGQLGQRLGISTQVMSVYENGREPPYEILCNIAKFFDVTTDYLLGLSNFRNQEERDIANMQAKDIVGLLVNTCPDVRPNFLSSLKELLLKCSDYTTNPSTFMLHKLEFIIEKFTGIVGAYSDGIATYSEYFSDPTNDTIEYIVMNSLPDDRFRNVLSDACFAILSEMNQLYKELPSIFSSDTEAIKLSANKIGEQEGSHGLNQETDH